MPKVPFRIVDVFAERPLSGNRLCVVPDPVPLDDATMQAIALEIGFSETTFVTEASDDRYRMRIFTPTVELPFAGHPTLGTAFVLVSEGRVTSPATQVVAAGEFHVEVDVERGRAEVRQLPPRYDDEWLDVESVALAIGLTTKDLHPEWLPQVVSTGLRHFIVPIESVEALVRARRDPERVGRVLAEVGADAMYLFAVTDEGAKARMFDADLGVGEDPATGSAAGPLGAYLVAHDAPGLPGRIVVRQGEEVLRPSKLEVEVYPEGSSWRVTVAGGVIVVGEGAFYV